MKTSKDLMALVSVISEIMAEEAFQNRTGISEYGEEEWKSCTYHYEENGWWIEFPYETTTFDDESIIIKIGAITETEIYHEDYETEEVSEFTEEEIKDFILKVENELR